MIMSEISKKIVQPQGFDNVVLEQDLIDTPDTELIQDSKKFIGRVVSDFKGYAYRYASLLPYTQTNFDSESFIPSATNSNMNNSIRRDAGSNFVGFKCVAPDYVSNVKQFRIDVLSNNAPYLANQINLSYPDEVSGENGLNKMEDIYKAQMVIASYNYQGADGETYTSDSLQSIYSYALGDYNGQNGQSVFDIDLTSTTNTNNVCIYTPKDSTNYNDSLLEAQAQFQSFLWKISKNPNRGTLPKDSTTPLTNAQYTTQFKEPVLVCRAELLEYLKSANYAVYKELNEYMKVGKLEVLPETIYNTNYNSSSSVAELSDIDSLQHLSTSQILIYDKDAFIQFSYPVVSLEKEQFINNITTSKYKMLCIGNHYKRNCGCAVYDYGTSINTLALPTLSISKN